MLRKKSKTLLQTEVCNKCEPQRYQVFPITHTVLGIHCTDEVQIQTGLPKKKEALALT